MTTKPRISRKPRTAARIVRTRAADNAVRSLCHSERSKNFAKLDAQVRHEMIAQAAYGQAAKRGFSGGPDAQLRDWLEAEADIDRRLAVI